VAKEPFLEIAPEVPVGFWVERFGADPQDFSGLRFYQRTPRLVWAADANVVVPECLDLEAIGMGFLRLGMPFPKPTTNATLAFGHLATKNVLNLDDEHAPRFLRRERFAWPDDEVDTKGFMIVRHQGVELGCGLWIEGHLSSMIPKSWQLKV
jgi:hypothetical protein